MKSAAFRANVEIPQKWQISHLSSKFRYTYTQQQPLPHTDTQLAVRRTRNATVYDSFDIYTHCNNRCILGESKTIRCCPNCL